MDSAPVKLSFGSSNVTSCAHAADPIAVTIANAVRNRAMVPPIQLSSRDITGAPMRHLPATALLVLAAACGSPPETPPDAPAKSPDAVLEKLRGGEAPADLRYDKHPEWTAEIGKALAEDRAWKSDADAFAAIVYYAAQGGADQVPLIEQLLTDPKPERRMRGLLIVRLSTSPESLELLPRYAAALLVVQTPPVAKVALGAMSYRRARGATEAILAYYEATDDPAALRALGRIWEGGGENPLRT